MAVLSDDNLNRRLQQPCCFCWMFRRTAAASAVAWFQDEALQGVHRCRNEEIWCRWKYEST